MKTDAAKVRQQAGSLPVFYTEWNISSNPRDALHDEPFAAAFATRTVMEARDLVQGYSFWTFSDIFSENYFPSMPFHGGFGLLNIHGVAKPIYRAFQLLHGLGKERLDVKGDHSTVDVWAVCKGNTCTILTTNLAMPRHPIQTEAMHLILLGAPTAKTAWLERIDDNHTNPRALWHSMGEPEYLSALQVDQLRRASVMSKKPQTWTCREELLEFDLTLPPQSVTAVTIEFG
jgi:xylan 1,4-beta-xylosidase